jgi:hypothetical protein
MIRLIVFIIILLIGFLGGFLMTNNLSFDDARFDVLVTSRQNVHEGFGLNYKKKYELWKFKDQFLGTWKARVFP